MDTITIPGIPNPLSWHKEPAFWDLSTGVLTMRAAPQTDWFTSPAGDKAADNAAALLFDSSPPEMLSAYVTVDDTGTFDAGVLAVYQNQQSWAKICLELSPQGKLMIVSVVTKGYSDDCNSYTIEGKSAYLRVSRLGRATAFHASRDGKWWDMVRHFSLNPDLPTKMGFLVQAPTGDGCTATFSQVSYSPTFLGDIRSGV